MSGEESLRRSLVAHSEYRRDLAVAIGANPGLGWAELLEMVATIKRERDTAVACLDELSCAVITSSSTAPQCACGLAALGEEHDCPRYPDFASPDMLPLDGEYPDHIPALGRHPSERP